MIHCGTQRGLDLLSRRVGDDDCDCDVRRLGEFPNVIGGDADPRRPGEFGQSRPNSQTEASRQAATVGIGLDQERLAAAQSALGRPGGKT